MSRLCACFCMDWCKEKIPDMILMLLIIQAFIGFRVDQELSY